MELKQSEKRFALLIDADNVSAKYLKPIMDELSKYGTVTYKRIYGDWTLAMHSKWKSALLENSITPIQQFGYTQGKNATDSAMIIDAMDILYTHSVEGFCIVSSDSDFTRLAARIRESGLMVIGMGEQKTPTPFRRACDIFTTLELLAGEKGGKRKGSGANANGASAAAGQAEAADAVSIASKEEIERAVVDIITDNQNNGKATGLGEVGSRLLKRYPDFDVRSYGTNLLSKLLDEFSSVKITKDGSNVAVELAENASSPAEAVLELMDALVVSSVSEAAVEAGGEEAAQPESSTNEAKPKRSRRRRKIKTGSAKVTSSVEPVVVPATESVPASAPDTPEAFIRDEVVAAGEQGVELNDLGKRVRASFKAFKVRDLGFRHMRAYVQSLDGLSVEKREEGFVVLAK